MSHSNHIQLSHGLSPVNKVPPHSTDPDRFYHTYLLQMLAVSVCLLWQVWQVTCSQYCPSGPCVPPVLCSPHYLATLLLPSSRCLLAPGTPGLCCPPSRANCKITSSTLTTNR